MPSDDKPPALDTPSYEETRDQLAEVVRRLEEGGLTLEESLELWERGEQLAGACQAWLDGARRRLDAVINVDHGDAADDGEAPGR